MGDLGKWVSDSSPYLRLKDGESVEAVYVGFKMIQDTFNPEKEKVRYILEVDGQTKYFDSGSTKVALVFDDVSEGQEVKITAKGMARDRKYTVEVVHGDK